MGREIREQLFAITEYIIGPVTFASLSSRAQRVRQIQRDKRLYGNTDFVREWPEGV